MSSKYPLEVFVSKKETKEKKQTFSLVNALNWQEDKPLAMNNLSRYVLTGIDIWKAGGNTIAVANIPAYEVAAILDEYHEVMMAEAIKPCVSAPTQEEWPKQEDNKKICKALAQTVKMGQKKGDPYYTVERKDLASYRDFLKKNVEKYKGNQKEIDLISALLSVDEAKFAQCVAFMKKRDEKTGNVSANSPKVIYNSGLKPRLSTTKEGKTMCYQIKIQFDSSRNYPFQLEITNLFCTVERTSTGSVNIHPNDAIEKKVVVINLSKQDGRVMFHCMEDDLQSYRTVTYGSQMRKALELDKKNKEEYRASTETE